MRSGAAGRVGVAGHGCAAVGTPWGGDGAASERGADSSTLREPTPSWALATEHSNAHCSTQTLTPGGGAVPLVDEGGARDDGGFLDHSASGRGGDLVSEIDELDDPFRGTGYRGVRLIGAGGMGQVYSVLHRELGCDFVAKLLRPELCGDLRTLDRVRIEAESLGRLEHPHVVSVTDFGYSAQGAPFIVMEPLTGMTLAQRLKQGPVPLRDALVFARATLSALSAAHALGIVHRDIKPHNLFLHESEDGRTLLKVLDFGVARVLPDAPPEAPIPLNLPTQTGMVLGTPRFVSPEAAAGRPVDTRGDLYSVGLVLYVLVAGRGPFDHVRGLSEVLNAHTLQTPDPPSRYAVQLLPPVLDEVILKALSKHPKHRYQTAHEFDAALVAVQRELPRFERSCAVARVPSWSWPPLPAGSPRLPLPSTSLPSLPVGLSLGMQRSSGSESSSAMPLSLASALEADSSLSQGAASSLGSLSSLSLRAKSSLSLRAKSSERWTRVVASLWAELKGTSARADRNAARPPCLPLRPMTSVALFVGTLLLTSLLGAGGATLLGRMVGGLP